MCRARAAIAVVLLISNSQAQTLPPDAAKPAKRTTEADADVWAPPWDAMIGTLAPNGRLHVISAVLEPILVSAFSLILAQRSVSGSPTGSPTAIATMLEFAARHDTAPQTEHSPMSHINEAFARLESGKARYRIVLDADF